MGARPSERHPLAPRLHAPVNSGPPAGAGPQSDRGPLGRVWTAALALLVLTWALIAWQVAAHREGELQAAGRDLANLTRLSQAHAERTLQNADQVLRFVRARYRDLGSRLDLGRLAEQGVIDTANFPRVDVADPQGHYALSSRPISGRTSLLGREPFKVHASSPADSLFISRPEPDRETGQQILQLTRRITLPDGAFGGVVMLSLDPGRFSRFHGDLQLGAQGVSSVIGMDGTARARFPEGGGAVAADPAHAPLLKRLAAGESSGAYTVRSPLDGVERLMHFRRLAGFDLVVVSGLGLDEVLAPHRRTRNALVLLGSLASLLILSLAASGARHLRQMRGELQARVQAQLELQQSTEQLRAIFGSSPDGLVGFDASGHVRQVNPAFLRMTGAEGGDIEGMSEAQFGVWLSARCQPGAGFERVAALQAQAGPQATSAQRNLMIAADKRVLQVGFGCADGPGTARVLAFRDVTHETEVAQIQSEFLATAAHELRTPMASVHGFAEVLSTQDLSEAERREFTDIILQQSGNMSRILDELLDLARMEARRGKDFKRRPLDLAALVHDTARAYKPAAGRQPPALEPDAPPMRVLADADKLRQALLNVLSNAYKYSPGGGPVAVQFLARGSGSAAQVGVCISDPGIGMNPAEAAQVFERFYRADKSGLVPGTGLGMSLVKEIMELHQGEVEIVSTAGQGTRVSLWLPEAGPPDGDPAHA